MRISHSSNFLQASCFKEVTVVMLQEWASPADQVLAMRRIRGDKHATIAAMHRAVDAVSHLHHPTMFVLY